jgi:hypothetical protein
MAYPPNLHSSFVAIPTRRKISFVLIASRLRHPSRRTKRAIWEGLDIVGNLAALATLLCAIALVALWMSAGK